MWTAAKRGYSIDQTLENLRSEVGPTPQLRKQEFQNWGKTLRKEEVIAAKPKVAEEVQKVLKAAKHQNLKVLILLLSLFFLLISVRLE